VSNLRHRRTAPQGPTRRALRVGARGARDAHDRVHADHAGSRSICRAAQTARARRLV